MRCGVCRWAALTFDLPGTLQVLMDAEAWAALDARPDRHQPLWNAADAWTELPAPQDGVVHWVRVKRAQVEPALHGQVSDDQGRMRRDVIWVVETESAHAMVDLRTTVLALDELDCGAPVVLRRTWQGLDDERLALQAATDLGGPMIDGLGDGLWVDAPETAHRSGTPCRLAFCKPPAPESAKRNTSAAQAAAERCLTFRRPRPKSVPSPTT